MKRTLLMVIVMILAFVLFIRICLGIFVIQPIGAIPNGVSIVYWRFGINLPFISSADGILDESGAGVSLLGRGILLSKIAEPIMERELFRFDYSQTLYLWSTGGIKYEK